MGKEKQWCSLTRICSLVYGQNKPVTVLLGYLRAQSILSSENYALILTAWVVLVTGTIVSVLEILPRIYQLIKQYFKSVQTEQAQATVSPRQATLYFFINS